MKRNVILVVMAVVMLSRCNSPQKNSEDEKVQEKDPLEVVANLTIRPGNVAVSSNNRVFTTVHPFGNPASAMELIEITGETTYEAFPNENYQNISEAHQALNEPWEICVEFSVICTRARCLFPHTI